MNSDSSARKHEKATAADRERQIEQLARMGVAVPDEYRKDLAIAGDWQKISEHKVEEPPPEESTSLGVRKRKYEGQEEEEAVGGEVARHGWGNARKRYPVNTGGASSDLDALLSTSVSLKKEEPEPTIKSEADAPVLPPHRLQSTTSEPHPDSEAIPPLKQEASVQEPDRSSLALVPSAAEAEVSIVFKKRRGKR